MNKTVAASILAILVSSSASAQSGAARPSVEESRARQIRSIAENRSLLDKKLSCVQAASSTNDIRTCEREAREGHKSAKARRDAERQAGRSNR